MKFQEYQEFTEATAVYPRDPEIMGVLYTALGLAGEAGEVADKVKKILRDDGGVVSSEKAKALVKELGDVLWYVSQLSAELGVSMESVARGNILKLSKRKDEGKLQGSGDDR